MTENQTRQFIKELEGGTYRECSQEEIEAGQASERLRHQLEQQLITTTRLLQTLRDSCNHPVCYDEQGFPHDVRICIVCGHNSLL